MYTPSHRIARPQIGRAPSRYALLANVLPFLYRSSDRTSRDWLVHHVGTVRQECPVSSVWCRCESLSMGRRSSPRGGFRRPDYWGKGTYTRKTVLATLRTFLE